MAYKGRWFKKDELKCRCCGYYVYNEKLLILLDKIRDRWGEPILVNCSSRCPDHNRAVGGVSNSHHITGKAADIRPSSAGRVYALYTTILTMYQNNELPELGGIGIYDTFVHVDVHKVDHLRKWDKREMTQHVGPY